MGGQCSSHGEPYLWLPCQAKVRRHCRKHVERVYKRHYGKPRPPVEHVVVLMLENRTFDNILGVLQDRRRQKGLIEPSRWDVHGQAGKGLYDYTNVVTPRIREDDEGSPDAGHVVFPVWSRDPATENIMSQDALGVPNGDPAEKFELLNLCVFEDEDPGEDDAPTLGGFAQEYYEREMHDLDEAGDEWIDKTDFERRRSPAMHVFLPEQVSVFTELAENFAVSDTYFSSAPCQTWPNRLFAATGHCYGYVNNLSDRGEAYDHDKMNVLETMGRLTQFHDETVFDRLSSHGQEWAIFYGDFPLAVMINRTLHEPPNMARTYPYSEFKKACDEGALPPFTWLEPQYLKGVNGSPPTDMHPPHNVLYAQNLVAEVYNSLRQNEELWEKTVLFITCDEGVGIFDHVPPPEAPDPKAGYNHKFFGQEDPRYMRSNPFKRYGTRVPLLAASPLLEPGLTMRPDADSEYPFDHTSLIRTIFDLFVAPDCHLTERDRQAPSFAPFFRSKPRKSGLGPKSISIGRELPEVRDIKAMRPNMQERGGCHSVQHLVPTQEKEKQELIQAAEDSPMLLRIDTGAALGGGGGQMLAQLDHMQDLFGQFGAVGERANRGFHWLLKRDKGEHDTSDEDSSESDDSDSELSHAGSRESEEAH